MYGSLLKQNGWILFIEKRTPLIISAVSGVILFFLKGFSLDAICNLKEMLAAIINIAAVIIGFLLTMISVLISLTGKKVIKRIKDNNATGILTSYFISPVALGFSLIILSTGLMPFDKLTGSFSHIFAVILFINAIYFITTTIRIAIMLLGILRKISDEVDPIDSKSKVKPYVPNQNNLFKK